MGLKSQFVSYSSKICLNLELIFLLLFEGGENDRREEQWKKSYNEMTRFIINFLLLILTLTIKF